MSRFGCRRDGTVICVIGMELSSVCLDVLPKILESRGIHEQVLYGDGLLRLLLIFCLSEGGDEA
jgi:hypothetical protein